MARPEGIAARLRALGRTHLNQLVRRLLNSDSAEIGESRLEPIAHPVANRNTGGLFRLAGTAADQGTTVPWSLILKVVHLPPTRLRDRAAERADTLDHYNYWKREPLVYQSGLLEQLTDELTAPRCLGALEQPGGAFWLWLEDVRPAAPAPWPLERYGQAARHLGRFQARYLPVEKGDRTSKDGEVQSPFSTGGRPLPNDPWLSRGWLRSFLANYWSPAARALLKRVEDPAAWEHPLVRAAFPVPMGDQILRLWEGRERLLLALEQLPQTLCHFDFHRGNLFSKPAGNGSERTVAIDWGFVGHGAVGEDIGHFLAASILFLHVAATEAKRLDELVFQGYLDGLRDAGWNGDPSDVRLACTAHAALRWGLLTADLLRLAHSADQHAKLEARARKPIAEVLAKRATMSAFVFDLAEEAWKLLGV